MTGRDSTRVDNIDALLAGGALTKQQQAQPPTERGALQQHG